MPGAPVLVIRRLEKQYRAGMAGCWAVAHTLLEVHLEIHDGEIVALVGAAGAGKTTLLHCAARLLTPDRGSVEYCPRADGTQSRVRYFADCVEAARAAARGLRWELALIDGIDRAQTDAGLAGALARVLARARAEATSLLLAAREAGAVQQWSDRIVTLQHGRVVHPAGPAIARVAEHAGPLTVIPGAPSIR